MRYYTCLNNTLQSLFFVSNFFLNLLDITSLDDSEFEKQLREIENSVRFLQEREEQEMQKCVDMNILDGKK